MRFSFGSMRWIQRRGGFGKPVAEVVGETLRTGWELIKITVPAIIATRILEELGLIGHISAALEPVMALVGLPGELGIVWATALLINPYAAVAVFGALAPTLYLTVGQVTVLGSMMLIAHSLPVELSIVTRAGAGFLPIGVLRLFAALAYGIILNGFCLLGGFWQEPARMLFQAGATERSLGQWIVAQIFNLGLIIFVIFCILVVMRLLRRCGVLALFERLLSPILPLFGMSRRAAPVTVVGMIMGLVYGGALIIKETTAGSMERREIFNSLALMSLSHGLIEDTLLMLALGASLNGVLWGRLLFSLLVLYCLTRLSAASRARTEARR